MYPTLSYDVLSEVFGKAAFTTTTQLLKNMFETIADISSYHTMGMKAADEQVHPAVDGEMCAKQA